MARFSFFSKLPLELQDAVWNFALANLEDPQPEVCLIWPLGIDSHNAIVEGPALPLTVDAPWPSIFHVCRASREFTERSGLLRLRFSPVAGFAVPYRLFNPAHDTLYWSRGQANAMDVFFKQPMNEELARSLRHIAVEIGVNFPPSILTELIRERAPHVRTLALVLADTAESPSIKQRFIPPARRCRLKDIPDKVLKATTVTDVPFLEPEMKRRQSLDAFLKAMLSEMDYHVREFGITEDEETGNEATAWSSADQSFTGIIFKAQTFVEYSGSEWVEVCGSRKFDLDSRESPENSIAVKDRQDPEKYRVLDDDCGSFRNSWTVEAPRQARMNKKRKLDRRAAESRNSQWANER
ncbi:hypothetical protein HJFPF1_13324 [Paramyrothecium foliicola]|nr:hypothetical protein HJFPF1_13324 [Paramyrothecium foliicola]